MQDDRWPRRRPWPRVTEPQPVPRRAVFDVGLDPNYKAPRLPRSVDAMTRLAVADPEAAFRAIVRAALTVWFGRASEDRRRGEPPLWFEGKPRIPVRDPFGTALLQRSVYHRRKDPVDTLSLTALLGMAYDAHAYSDEYPELAP